jgi:hypothetical protein
MFIATDPNLRGPRSVAACFRYPKDFLDTRGYFEHLERRVHLWVVTFGGADMPNGAREAGTACNDPRAAVGVYGDYWLQDLAPDEDPARLLPPDPRIRLVSVIDRLETEEYHVNGSCSPGGRYWYQGHVSSVRDLERFREFWFKHIEGADHENHPEV